MKRDVFLNHISTILIEEGWQVKKGRTIKTSAIKQCRAINAIAKALGLEKITVASLGGLSFG